MTERPKNIRGNTSRDDSVACAEVVLSRSGSFDCRRGLLVVVAVLVSVFSARGSLGREAPVIALGEGGRLVYATDERGNRVPDFSRCGYMGQDKAIPNVPVRIVVSLSDGDNTQRIQKAIDYVAALPTGDDGVRGAVLLLKGRYEIWGGLDMSASGVVLRGQGMGENGTVLVAAGTDRRTLIRIAGKNDRTNPTGRSYEVKDDHVPVGARSFSLNTTEGLSVGETVNIIRPSTQEWIDVLGMGSFGGGLGTWRGWKPGSQDLAWDRIIESIDGNRLVVDAPITTAIEARFGGAAVEPYAWPGRINHVGVENLRCESAFDPNNPKDEAHSWMAITMENVENAWVRQVTMAHFAGSAVALWGSSKWVTVQDCMSLAPVSEEGGYRRHTFFTMGQLTLFLHCWAEQGRHDFSAGHSAAGPNAFVQCEASLSQAGSGPIESWASGTLYDGVTIDGGALRLGNLASKGQGIGWAAANSILWQCSASVVHCDSPPTARNWAIGCWGELAGDGIWRQSNDFAEPKSLYAAQVRDRLGEDAAERLHLMPFSTSGYTSPTVEVARKMTVAARAPAPSLSDYITEAATRCPIPCEPGQARALDEVMAGGAKPERPASRRAARRQLSVTNGWLTCDGTLLVGASIGVPWWRGTIRPSEAPSRGPAVTRFVPGRTGLGFIDNLDELTDTMVAKGQAVLNHNYGLWYDRRRDDHERVRRTDGDVLPPFYELPFARSGQGIAWDGLSKYDLTRYNPWYWNRLREFAGFCDEKGLALFHQNYFQHNILEAGAHWADFPWRTANNINGTGFPEPPPYAGNKRIFMDEQFYDVNHPVRKRLHRAYIRKCLDNFRDNANVIQSIGAEFTGPLKFVQFWLDTIGQWQRETGSHPIIALSCTKDVQDAVLTDPVRSGIVSVIDIRYWWYESDGDLYAPEGGEHLAPRQHARLLHPQRTSFAQVVRAVREYRREYPDKAVLYSADPGFGWAVLMAGGSIPDIRSLTDPALLAAVRRMKPADFPAGREQQYALSEPGRNYLVYAASGETIELDLTQAEGTFEQRWLDPQTGRIEISGHHVNGGAKVAFRTSFTPCVLWLTR